MSEYSGQHTMQTTQNNSTILSRLFLLWSVGYARLWHEHNATQKDLAQVEYHEPFDQTFNRWGTFWRESTKQTQEEFSNGDRIKWTIKKTFQRQLIVAAIMSFIAHQASAATPLIVYIISLYIARDNLQMKDSVILLLIICTLKFMRAFLAMHSEYNLKKIGSNIFCCLCYSLTQKSLKKINYSKGEITISEKAKLAQYDCAKVIEYIQIWTDAVFQLYSLIFSVICLFFIAGWEVLVSCIMLFAINMIRYIMVTIFKKFQKRVNEEASQRIKKETETVNNIKFIKVNALQNLFFNKLNDLRTKEVNNLYKFLNLGIFTSVMQNSSSRISIVVFILIYVMSGHEINSALIFSILLFYNTMALHRLMNKTSNLEDISISLAKIQEFLINEERDNSYISRNFSSDGENSIIVRGGSFYWEKEEDKEDLIGEIKFSLKNIDFSIKKGEFIALIGEYGSGKSSILNAILGEMNNESSNVSVNGTIAYANQTPWILNDSVKNNILFGQPYEEKRYFKALKYSRLETDLHLFTNGDETVIGEKGSTLSGGQRARISLARALYKQADIYILDDILSALDAHVSAFIFQQTLTKHLKGKTIILATHLINYLNLVNRVFLIEQGKIKEIIEKSELMPTLINVRRESSLNNRRMSTDSFQADNDKIQKLKVVQDKYPLIESEEISQSQLFKLFVKRKGGALYVIVTIVFMILIIVTNLLLLSWLNYWMNSKDNTNSYYYQMYLTILGANLICMGTHAFVEYNSDFFNELHRTMIKNLISAPMSYFQTTSTSNTMSKLSNDLKKIDNEVVPQFRNTVFFISFGIAFICNSLIIYTKKNQISMIILIVASIFVIIYFYYYFMVAIRQIHRLLQKSQIPIYSSFVEILFGASTIRAYNKQDFMKEKQKSIIERYLLTHKIMAGVEAFFTFVISIVTMIITTGLFIKILILKDGDKVDFFLIYNILSFERTVENVHGLLFEFLNNLKYLGYCEELMIVPPEEGYDFVLKDGSYVFKDRVPSEWIKEGKIEFEKYSVKYRPELETVLKDLTLSIKPNQKIGVVGRTGSGKSTTILSLLRILQAHEGTIKIDDIDIYSIDIQKLRVGFSIILQEHFLFSGTVRENIDPLSEFEDAKIIHAFELCGLWDNIKSRNGLDTVVEQGGNNFSAGEKQLINISRTLLNPKKIVLVDEATASIDNANDEMLQKVIKEQLSNSTMFTIAHRIETIMSSDRIMVLDKGRILELDTPTALLQRQESIFRSLYKQSLNRESAEIFPQ